MHRQFSKIQCSTKTKHNDKELNAHLTFDERRIISWNSNDKDIDRNTSYTSAYMRIKSMASSNPLKQNRKKYTTCEESIQNSDKLKSNMIQTRAYFLFIAFSKLSGASRKSPALDTLENPFEMWNEACDAWSEHDNVPFCWRWFQFVLPRKNGCPTQRRDYYCLFT